MENTDGVCALCHYNWFEENDLTLLCSNNDCKPLECHVFCLDYLDRSGIKISNTGGPNGSKHHEKTTNNLNLPEEDRDWYCPACHPYGTLISLLQYFEWSKNISRKRDAQDEFQNFIMTDPVRLIGRVIRLHIPFPVTATHLGRIVDQRITHDQVEYFIQFRSPVNGRNLPYSCWMNLSHHDCSVSDEIVKICFHPDEESTKWTLATRYYLSGVEFNLNLTGTVSQGHGTTNSPTISYVEFGRDEYSQIPNQSQSESETPTVVENPVILPFSDTVSEDLSPVFLSMARSEIYERYLISWRYQSYQHLRTYSELSPRTIDIISPSWSTLSVNDLQFYPVNHPNTEEYNTWLAMKHYYTNGASLDGGSLHDMFKYLDTSKGKSTSVKAENKPPTHHSRIMNHSLLSSDIHKSSTSSSSSSSTSTPSKKVGLHPSLSYEINRYFFQYNSEITKKRKWEDEKDALIHQIENKVLVCIDINKLSYQQGNSSLLLLEGIAPQTPPAVGSKVLCVKRIINSHERYNFPTCKWNNLNVFDRIRNKYEKILEEEKLSSSVDVKSSVAQASSKEENGDGSKLQQNTKSMIDNNTSTSPSPVSHKKKKNSSTKKCNEEKKDDPIIATTSTSAATTTTTSKNNSKKRKST